MRETKWLSIITAGVSILSFVVVLLCYGNANFKLIYDICLAIFGGALLGFIMSLTQYFAVKRKSMEEFYTEALKAVNILGKAKYFLTNEPVDLVVNCIAEEQHNKWNAALPIAPEHTSRDKLIEEYKRELDPIIVNDPSSWYTNSMNTYYKDLEKCFDSYIEIADTKFGALDNAYGNLDFIFGNRSLRQWVYETIYNPFEEIWRSAVSQAYHFQLYKAGKGNRAVCTTILLELNKEWFSAEDINDENMHCISIYRKHYDTLSDALEEFRCKIYKQQSVEQEKHNPIISKIPLIKDENE